MSYDDDFYTDEPLVSPQPSPNGEGDAKPNDARSLWDYVAPPQTSGGEGDSWGHASPPPFGGGWGEADESVPQDIALLMSMIRQNYWSIVGNKSFYEEALFMAGYEDDYRILPFNTYFPTYSQMSVGQLRSYFTIRKLLRQGKHPDVPLSYLFVYAYETLMQIGVANPEEGYEILCDLRDNYPVMNPERRPYISEWLRDYVVWYGLSNHFADCFSEELRNDNACEILNYYNKATDEQLFNVLDDNSRHVVTKGALYKKQPEAAVKGVAYIMRKVAPVIEKHYGNKLGTLCFGRHTVTQHVMFETAVFYSPNPIKDATVEVAPLHKYVCHNGIWKTTSDVTYTTLPPASLRKILHDIDASIRQRISVKPAIKLSTFNPGSYHAYVLRDAADEWLGEWKAGEAERREKVRIEAIHKARESVSIDLSKLGSIRKDADVVRDKLIVDEEGNEEKPQAEESPEKTEKVNILPPVQTIDSASESELPEVTFIRKLLQGGDYQAYLRSIHTPAGVMVEKINDKAMEVIGDIVLEDDGEKITVIDDYREDIQHLYD